MTEAAILKQIENAEISSKYISKLDPQERQSLLALRRDRWLESSDLRSLR